ncbi:hypothetical protein [Anabaena sp. FACHB-1237]|uniref:hypothetical protein n=1 Tax=Anabaena sp. FACHB-1237 TaxID=2692769 RepID=UPI001F557CEA|nr:hypothetical protein [Anabaena sp. FACHB-1237]
MVSYRRVALADKLHNSRYILTDKRQKKDVIWDKFGGKKSRNFMVLSHVFRYL